MVNGERRKSKKVRVMKVKTCTCMVKDGDREGHILLRRMFVKVGNLIVDSESTNHCDRLKSW